ncbi:hypothetical protein NQ317_008334 [Molorchus minor]|uniref:DUF5641 domain-containing protein n=1 Tax=Molorchus minor TaxID=1323400 RepID=A0ABQ9JS74_9CUCU|nr:hypothetical protein NQ317_008334 [Molorchus minor]
MSYVIRFIKNLRSKPHERLTGSLSIPEINEATNVLIKLVQAEAFKEDIMHIQKTKYVSHNSKLASLNPFLDQTGILRVGGRLRNSLYAYTKKHPAVLPSKSHFTNLIIDYEHKRLLHAGGQAVLGSIRDVFWPLNGRRLVRQRIRKCLTCFRANPVQSNPIMGELPITRITPVRPFTITGVDYAGPFLIKDALSTFPEEDICSVNPARLSNYKQLQQIVQHFWCRWSKEYVNNLQQRTKWKQQTANELKPGLMVLLREDNVPPLKWLLGRIVKTYPDSDGTVRVVDIKTRNGMITRAFSKICVLPIDIG